MDWVEYYRLTANGEMTKKKREEKRDEIHSKTKDNSKMNFTYGNSNPYVKFGYFPFWHWEEVDSKEKNVRYVEAKKNSLEYLTRIMRVVN